MATENIHFKVAVNAADALAGLGQAARRCGDVLRGLIDVTNPLWATLPGEWPDQFILLNRYLRTGTKPPFLSNE